MKYAKFRCDTIEVENGRSALKSAQHYSENITDYSTEIVVVDQAPVGASPVMSVEDRMDALTRNVKR